MSMKYFLLSKREIQAPHHSMDASANDAQREEIRELVMSFMNQN